MSNDTSHGSPPPLSEQVLAEIARDCLCLGVRKTSRLVTQWYDACLQPSGLRSTQFNLLVAISLAKAAPLTRLADGLALDRTTLATNLKPLERGGLVVVEPGEDRRVRLVRLTTLGQQRLQEAMPYWRKAQEGIMGRMGQAQWEALHTDLRSLAVQIPSP